MKVIIVGHTSDEYKRSIEKTLNAQGKEVIFIDKNDDLTILQLKEISNRNIELQSVNVIELSPLTTNSYAFDGEYHSKKRKGNYNKPYKYHK